ncbi:TetR/AcrR family transcriptional regulator [Pseudomonas sp. CIP-10]|uniref:TetR/AcrR family transcriptional regulator n=1 Tax=Pseudomonas sp. CIP-10 TaxID=2892442 RepID=UPI001E494007|nr:TetR/AcrR family transcriptional regulator [Pseudomonas sp. CIP-10]UFH30036.1 TetR/AcrR family transcriptional regulator [Pseudomonas sp. CIP-10]
MHIRYEGNAPQQDRSRASLERLMMAAREILSEGTFEQLTIAEISKRSKVSVGSIYARFKGKDELFLAVMMDVMDEIQSEWSGLILELRSRQLPLEVRVPAVVDALAEHLHKHAGILQPFMGKASDPRVAMCGKSAYQSTAKNFVDFILESSTDIQRSDAERAVNSCFTIVYAALARFLGLGSAPDAAGEGNWAFLKADLGQMCLGFLKQGSR